MISHTAYNNRRATAQTTIEQYGHLTPRLSGETNIRYAVRLLDRLALDRQWIEEAKQYNDATHAAMLADGWCYDTGNAMFTRGCQGF